MYQRTKTWFFSAVSSAFTSDRGQRGSLLVSLIFVIGVAGLLCATILSLLTTGAFSQIGVNNAAKAQYLAESGLRYAQIADYPTDTYYTFTLRDDGTFERHVDLPPPAPPYPVGKAGFRLRVSDCRVEAFGVVHEESPFEAVRKIVSIYPNGMPCWNLNQEIDVTDPDYDLVIDAAGANTGDLIAYSGIERNPVGAYGWAIAFDGTNYVATDFRPACEFFAGDDFTVSFWANPLAAGNGTVLGINDGVNRFTVGVRAGDWFWAFGNRDRAVIPRALAQWQHVTVSHDSAASEVRMHVEYVGGGSQSDTFDYGAAGGNGVFPEPVGDARLYLGAENMSGGTGLHFVGRADEIAIYDTVIAPGDLVRFCQWEAPVAYLPLDGDALDISGNGHDGVLDAPIPVPGRIGDAFSFDGVDDAIHIDHDPELNLTYAGSVSAWIYLNALSPLGGIVHKGDQPTFNDETYTLQFGWDGFDGSRSAGLRLALRRTNTIYETIDSTTDFAVGQWYHVVGTWDLRHTVKRMTLYVNGEVDGGRDDLTINQVRNTNGGVNIGAQLLNPHPTFGKFPFNGIIDDVRIFDRELRPAEVWRIYTNS